MLRVSLSFALLSGWLVLLLSGWSFGGAVYLLLLASLVIFPWRLLRDDDGLEPREPETGDPS